MSTPVLACAEFDTVDPNVCTVQVWIDQPTLLPPLSIGAAFQLLGAIYLCWMVAWGWKQINRSVRYN